MMQSTKSHQKVGLAMATATIVFSQFENQRFDLSEWASLWNSWEVIGILPRELFLSSWVNATTEPPIVVSSKLKIIGVLQRERKN